MVCNRKLPKLLIFYWDSPAISSYRLASAIIPYKRLYLGVLPSLSFSAAVSGHPGLLLLGSDSLETLLTMVESG